MVLFYQALLYTPIDKTAIQTALYTKPRLWSLAWAGAVWCGCDDMMMVMTGPGHPAQPSPHPAAFMATPEPYTGLIAAPYTGFYDEQQHLTLGFMMSSSTLHWVL